MIEVTAYKTKDGRLFANKKDALQWERAMNFEQIHSNRLYSLDNFDDFCTFVHTNRKIIIDYLTDGECE